MRRYFLFPSVDVTDLNTIKSCCQELEDKVKAGIDYLILNAGEFVGKLS